MKNLFFVLILSVFACTFQAFGFADTDSVAPTPAVTAPAPVLVDVDGVKLTLADFGRKHPGGLFHASQAFYDAERRVIETWIDEYLLDREAKKEGVTVDELLKKHVNSAGDKELSEESVRVYYEGVDTDQPFEAVKQQIIDHIKEGRIAKAKAAYMKQLRSQAHISLLFGAPRAPISLKDTVLLGQADSPVVVVEYADYECPYCQNAQAAFAQIEKEFKGKVAFAYKDMPLPNHPHAQKAAEATHCAAAQGKYWEYHDMLFQTKALEVPQLKEHARALKLDGEAFDKCLDSGAQAEAVKAEFNEGVGFGLQGTPGFFVNGHVYAGVLSVAQFREIIGQELATSGMGQQGRETAKR